MGSVLNKNRKPNKLKGNDELRLEYSEFEVSG